MILFDFYFNLDFVDVTIKIFDLLILLVHLIIMQMTKKQSVFCNKVFQENR